MGHLFPTGQTDPAHNHFEAVARARKVGRLRSYIDRRLLAGGLDPEHPLLAARLAHHLAAHHTEADREWLAREAGVKTPSPESWAELVEVYQQRAQG